MSDSLNNRAESVSKQLFDANEQIVYAECIICGCDADMQLMTEDGICFTCDMLNIGDK